jgi:hypothetical protein
MEMWKSPFNKVVRSHEAGIVGLLGGIMIGVAAMFFVPVVVKGAHAAQLHELCPNSVPTIISISYAGEIVRAECEDGTRINN